MSEPTSTSTRPQQTSSSLLTAAGGAVMSTRGAGEEPCLTASTRPATGRYNDAAIAFSYKSYLRAVSCALVNMLPFQWRAAARQSKCVVMLGRQYDIASQREYQEFINDFTSRLLLTYRWKFSPLPCRTATTPEEDIIQNVPSVPQGVSQPPPPQRRKTFASVFSRTSRTSSTTLTTSTTDHQHPLTSDEGWGCMIRVFQMAVAQIVMNLTLGRNWRRPSHKCVLGAAALYRPTPIADQPTSTTANNKRSSRSSLFRLNRLSSNPPPPPSADTLTPHSPPPLNIYPWNLVPALSLVRDDPSARFSVHRVVWFGHNVLGIKPGEWFGPTSCAQCITHLINGYEIINQSIASPPDLAYPLTVYNSEVHAVHSEDGILPKYQLIPLLESLLPRERYIDRLKALAKARKGAVDSNPCSPGGAEPTDGPPVQRTRSVCEGSEETPGCKQSTDLRPLVGTPAITAAAPPEGLAAAPAAAEGAPNAPPLAAETDPPAAQAANADVHSTVEIASTATEGGLSIAPADRNPAGFADDQSAPGGDAEPSAVAREVDQSVSVGEKVPSGGVGSEKDLPSGGVEGGQVGGGVGQEDIGGGRAVVLFISLRLGLTYFNLRYQKMLQSCFEMECFQGLAGGGPLTSAYWFVACTDEHLYYLDPHSPVQPAMLNVSADAEVDVGDRNNNKVFDGGSQQKFSAVACLRFNDRICPKAEVDNMFFPRSPHQLPWNSLNPSMTLVFLVKSVTEFETLLGDLERVDSEHCLDIQTNPPTFSRTEGVESSKPYEDDGFFVL